MCYYCRKDGFTNLENHKKKCQKYLKIEKKSKRISKQVFFGKKKKTTRS